MNKSLGCHVILCYTRIIENLEATTTFIFCRIWFFLSTACLELGPLILGSEPIYRPSILSKAYSKWSTVISNTIGWRKTRSVLPNISFQIWRACAKLGSIGIFKTKNISRKHPSFSDGRQQWPRIFPKVFKISVWHSIIFIRNCLRFGKFVVDGLDVCTGFWTAWKE